MKKTLYYFSFLFIVSWVGCKSSTSNTIPIFNDIEFQLESGEKLAKITAHKKSFFGSFFMQNTIQIPLYRCIESDSLLIFIGIPFNTSIKELGDIQLAENTVKTYFEGDSTTYLLSTYDNDTTHIAIHTQNFSNNLIYLLAVSKIAEFPDFLSKAKSLSARFKN